MAAEISCFREVPEMMDNMLQAYLTNAHYLHYPIDPKYNDAIERIQKIIDGMFMIAAGNDFGVIHVRIK